MSVLTNKEIRQFKSCEDLIQPFGLDHFLANYHEKDKLIIDRNDPDYYQGLFSLDEVDTVLDTGRPRDESLRIVKNQVPLLPTKYQQADGSLNLNQIYTAYADGYTIVINELDRYSYPVKTLCQSLSHELSYAVKANMYLTPKKQSALLPHYDTHDVFILQIHGKKHWRLYDSPVETPMLHSHQPVFRREHLRNMQEITLNAGDFMYMPRGLPHEAYTTDESSLHITVGIYPSQWADLLAKTIHQLAMAQPQFRKALPAGFLRQEKWNKEFYKAFNDQFLALLQEVAKVNNPMAAVGLLSEDLRGQNTPKGDGHFRMLDQMDELTLNSVVFRRDGINSTVQPAGAACRIIFPGNVIKGPSHIAPALRFISEATEPFKLSELPSINDTNKVKLAARLIRGGLLRVV